MTLAAAVFWLATTRPPADPETAAQGQPAAGGVPGGTDGVLAEPRSGAASLDTPAVSARSGAEREWASIALRNADARRRSIPVDHAAAVHFQEGEAAMRGGDWDLAVQRFQQFIGRDPASVWAPLAFASIADARLLKGDLESLELALDQFEEYLEFFPESGEAEGVALKRDLLNLALDREGRLRPDARAELLAFLHEHPEGDPARLAEYLLERIEVLGGTG